jgi:uncharacterized protein YqjF (DUF2071 family)
VPGLSRFHETNVRTYVHHAGRDPGVWFFSLDAASWLAVALAHLFFHLPYFHARMRLSLESSAITYVSRRSGSGSPRATCLVQCTPAGSPTLAPAGTLEHFLAERYVLYAAHGGRLFRGQVHHAAYPLQTAEVRNLDETLLAAAGIERPGCAPLAHYARGVRVEVFPLARLI